MKANELMLGDHASHIEEGKYCVVTQLRGREVAVSFTDDKGNTKYSELLPETALEPIPITAEILGKNFNSIENLPYRCRYYYYTDYTEFEITDYTDSIWKVDVDVKMSCLPIQEMYVSYVHELQHALKLCGIDKEIKL